MLGAPVDCSPRQKNVWGHSAAPEMSLTENALLTGSVREKLVDRGFLRWNKTEKFARRIIEAFDVRTPGPDNAAGSLSGGNLQKFVIGREVLQNPDVLVVNQPHGAWMPQQPRLSGNRYWIWPTRARQSS